MAETLLHAENGIIVPVDPHALISKAIEHNVAIDTMERLLALRDRLKAEQSREAFFKALAGFQADCPVIPKTKEANAGSYRYKYAPLESIVRTVGPFLDKHGLSYTFQTRLEDAPTLSQVAICTVHHIAGHSESSEFKTPVDTGARMNVMQQGASAQTYAKRYAFCNALGILTGDEDDDSQAAGKDR